MVERMGARAFVASVLTAMGVACGDDNGGSSPPPEDRLLVAKPATGSGDNQTGVVGNRLAAAIQVVVTRGGEPQQGIVVTWATPDGGLVAPPTSTTLEDGTAGALWDLGPDPGTQTATATVDDADGSPVTFTATAEDDAPPPPPPAATIQVLGPSGGNRFDPTEVTIQAGQTVKWSWPSGSFNHNVEPDGDEPARSGNPGNGPMEYSFTFTTAGTYDFYCVRHGAAGGIGMSGTVIVEP